MKIIIYLLAFIINASAVLAQQNSGTIIYEEKMNLHKSIPEEMADLKERIPEFRTIKKLLHFTSEEALYSNKPKDPGEEEEMEGPGDRSGRGGMRMRLGGRDGEEKFYTNFSDGISIDERHFFGKDFLISGTRVALKWKITGDQKQVGEYLCQKAIFQDSTTNLVAWFTPMIPVSTGPDDYFGLPGMILHIDIDEGTKSITAIEIKLQELEEGTIVKPTKGKELSKEEFDKIREEKMKEMEESRGGRGGHRYMFSRG